MKEMMTNPYTTRRVRLAYVLILGKLWMPSVTASMRTDLRDYDLENIGEFTRENVEQWLMTHSGDFSSVTDFCAVCGNVEIPWSSEENEMIYLETISEPDFDDE